MTEKKPEQIQKEKFIEAAHMVEADHDEAAFEKRLKKIAKLAPEEAKKP
jgi:hypothetical protein